MVERDMLEGQLAPLLAQLVPGYGPGQGVEGRPLIQVWHQDGVPDRGELALDLCYLFHTGEAATAIPVTVYGDQERGLDLLEPIHHATGPEFRGASGPYRADTGRGEESHEGLRDVWHECGHPVPSLHPQAS